MQYDDIFEHCSDQQSYSQNSDGGYGDSALEKEQRRFLAQLETDPHVRIIQVLFGRTGKNDKELSVVKGELLKVSSIQ